MMRRSWALVAVAASALVAGFTIPGRAQDKDTPAPSERPADDSDKAPQREKPATDPRDADRTPDRAKTETEETYTADARVVIASNDDIEAPTLFGRYPSKGTLEFVGVGEILSGKLGATVLDGTRFGLLGRGSDYKPGHLVQLHFYVDSGVDVERSRALVRILLSDDRLRARNGSFSFTTVNLAHAADAPDTWTGSIGDHGTFTVKPIVGGDGKNPVTIGNPFSIFEERAPVGLGISTVDFKDHSRELKWSMGGGEIHQVRFSGPLLPEDLPSEKKTETPLPEPR